MSDQAEPTADGKRGELFTEYLKMIDVVQGYDAHFVSIKAWSVTTRSVALGFVLSERGNPLGSAHHRQRRWRSVAFWPNVMLPHVMFVGVVPILSLWLAVA